VLGSLLKRRWRIKREIAITIFIFFVFHLFVDVVKKGVEECRSNGTTSYCVCFVV
jgi:hypothetical protein